MAVSLHDTPHPHPAATPHLNVLILQVYLTVDPRTVRWVDPRGRFTNWVPM